MSPKQTRVSQPHDRIGPDATDLPSLGREFLRIAALYGLTAVLFSWIFAPRGIWPLAFVCLVPWAAGTCLTRRAWLVHWLSFFFGWVFFLANLRWLMPVTGLGYAALAFYLALYWPIAAWALRTGRRHGISPLWTLPVVWVACEYLRAWVMSGFPWLFISHAFYEQLWLIQISDLTGAYGVSFLAALVNGVLAALVLEWRRPAEHTARRRQLMTGTVVTVLVLTSALWYGVHRSRQTDFATGPRVAVIQHDFPLHSVPPYSAKDFRLIFAEYVRLAADAAAEKPDLLVFPETVWGATQNLEFLSVERNALDDVHAGAWRYGKLCDQAISAFARGDYTAVNRTLDVLEESYRNYERRWGREAEPLPRLPATGGPPVAVVVGATSIESFPEATYPKMKRYNSALMYDVDGQQRKQRYDKNHLVPFGEIVPFRYGRLHWLYRRLNELSPFSYGGTVEYSLSPGTELTEFQLKTSAGETRFGTPICYEDVMPYVIRRYAWDGGRRRVDFLVNISNDAWFLYGNELPQHLAICAFRAVENRVSIARAVNTGISGFINPNGHIYSAVEESGRRHGPGIIGYRVEPMLLDQRGSFYGHVGDWFAGGCLLLTVSLWLVAVTERWILALRQRLAAWRGGGDRDDGTTRS